MPDREKVIKGLEQFKADMKPFFGNHADWERFDAGLDLLKEQNGCENSAIAIEDRQPVVRCKDCRYWTSEKILEYHICKRWEKTGIKNFATAWNWFCADGERKEGR